MMIRLTPGRSVETPRRPGGPSRGRRSRPQGEGPMLHQHRATPPRRGRWATAAAIAAGLAFTAHAALSDDPHISGMNADSFAVGSFVTIYGDNFGEAMGPSYVMYGDRPVPIVFWSNHVITGVLPAHLFGTPLPSGVPAQLVVHVQPGDHQSNAMPVQIAQVTNPGSGSMGNGTTPTTGGTTQPAVSRNQILNDALLVERLAAQ